MTIQIDRNRLHEEKSLYLQQHKDNPVHWWPYGPEAILKAKEENKPIFLSIGYSSCHWCHVMAHESFENQSTADLLNDHYIAIKVDREEYPDLDQYYQSACQLFNKNGGWPLSAFLLPDTKPYFIGTYFPVNPREGMTTFNEVLTELHRAYHEDRETVLENANKAYLALTDGPINREKVQFEGHFPHPMSIIDALEQYQDNENGGYGVPPKFPTFAFYEWALEQMLEGMINKEKGQHIIKSLEKMLMGGIFDHCRGGIHRYSTDEKWLVPHFEKMLYDQAGYLRMAAKLSLIYPSPIVFDGLIHTLDYLKNEMTDDHGHFFSAQDADSEGMEGLYFTYTEEEFNEAITKTNDENLIQSLDELKTWFGITSAGNFEQGLNIISLDSTLSESFFSSTGWEKVRAVKKALLNERKMRTPPVTDNKGIASWNFLMMTSLLEVAQYCQIESIHQMALNIFKSCYQGVYQTFILAKDPNGEEKFKIKHVTTKETSLAYFEDYVFFAEMQLKAYQILGNQAFKDNFEQTLHYIHKEFIKAEKVYTRALSMHEHEDYPNIQMNGHDGSCKSPLATYIGLVRRASALFLDIDLLQQITEVQEQLTHEVLKNPLAAGEGLRVLTYPKEAYRLIKIPKTWTEKPDFQRFISYFLPRFVLDYHELDNDEWQICNITACELKGTGLTDFINTLSPQKEQKEQKEQK